MREMLRKSRPAADGSAARWRLSELATWATAHGAAGEHFLQELPDKGVDRHRAERLPLPGEIRNDFAKTAGRGIRRAVFRTPLEKPCRHGRQSQRKVTALELVQLGKQVTRGAASVLMQVLQKVGMPQNGPDGFTRAFPHKPQERIDQRV